MVFYMTNHAAQISMKKDYVSCRSAVADDLPLKILESPRFHRSKIIQGSAASHEYPTATNFVLPI